jgi:hypothetical protein
MEESIQNPPVKVSPPGDPEKGKSKESPLVVPTNEQKYRDLLGLLQNTRVEAQNLRSLFCELEDDIVTYESRRDMAEIVAPYQEIYKNNKDEIDTQISRMKVLVLNDPGFNQWMGDDIKIIENKWERFNCFYPDFNNDKNDVIIIGIRKCSVYLSDIVYQCSFKSIPERLMQHLKTVANGQALDFYETFKDEVCSEEQAKKIIEFLANHPNSLQCDQKTHKGSKGALCGVIDPALGLVYKIGTADQIRMSAIKILFWSIVALIGSYLILNFYKSSAISSMGENTSFGNISALFIVMLGGAAAHIAIGMLKETRSAKPQQRLAIDDLMLWIHIKESSMISGLMILVLGFLIMMVTYPSIKTEVIFVAGYSIDSLGDLFIARFETTMNAKGEVLKTSMTKE